MFDLAVVGSGKASIEGKTTEKRSATVWRSKGVFYLFFIIEKNKKTALFF
jgi:hypothetical protein